MPYKPTRSQRAFEVFLGLCLFLMCAVVVGLIGLAGYGLWSLWLE